MDLTDSKLIGTVQGGTVHVYSLPHTDGLKLVDLTGRQTFTFEDTDGPLYYLSAREDFVCEGTLLRWPLETEEGDVQRERMASAAAELETAADRLRAAAQGREMALNRASVSRTLESVKTLLEVV